MEQMPDVKVNTSKGPRSPQEVLAMIVDPQTPEGDVRGMLKSLSSVAPEIAKEAADKILGAYSRFGKKTQDLAREVKFPEKEKTFGDIISENADRFR